MTNEFLAMFLGAFAGAFCANLATSWIRARMAKDLIRKSQQSTENFLKSLHTMPPAMPTGAEKSATGK